MADQKKSTSSAQTPAVHNRGLQVVARTASFWRAGLQFGHEPRTLPLADLTSDQQDAIRAEARPGGMLVVTEVDIPLDNG